MKIETTLRRGRAARQGSVFLFAVTMLGIASLSVAWVTAMVWGHVRMTARAEGRLCAFYAAESGVQQVVDWFNRGYYTWFEDFAGSKYPNTTFHTWADGLFSDTTFQNLFQPFLDPPNRGCFLNAEGTSSFLFGSTQDSVVISKRTGEEQNAGWLAYLPSATASKTGFSLGYVEELRIVRPAAKSGAVCHIISIGREPATGATATVETDLSAPWMPELIIPAALMSKDTAGSNGHFNVHWGETWTAGNLDILNPIDKKYWDMMKDPWFHGRSETWTVGTDKKGKLYYLDGSVPGYFSLTPPAPSSPNYLQPLAVLNRLNLGQLSGYQQSFYQHVQGLPWPDYSYQEMKQFCARHGQVYTPFTDKNGTTMLTVGQDEKGQPVMKTFDETFNNAIHSDPDTMNRDIMPPLIFIDTYDGQPPKADGSNVPLITVLGNGSFFYGYFFIAGNVRFGGSGNSPSYDAPERPDKSIATSPIANARLAGLLYSYGHVDFQGGGEVYGAVYAKTGFAGGGNWGLWYDWRLRDPLRNRMGSRVAINRWDSYYHYPSKS